MSDRPWLAENAPELRLERELLKELNLQQPAASSIERGWAALAAQGATPGAAQASGAAAGLGVAAKVAAAVVVAGGAMWAASTLMLSDGAPARQPSGSVRPVGAPLSVRVDPPPHQTASAPGSSRPGTVKAPEPGAARSTPSVTTLAEEGRLLASAHQLVQAGRGAEALKVLRSLQARFPRSVLSQEREVLTIEALGASGSSAAARSQAERFLARHPRSPHAGRLQRFVE